MTLPKPDPDCENCCGTGFYTLYTAPDAWAVFDCECLERAEELRSSEGDSSSREQ